MYSERSLADGIERSPEQFFKQYRPKNPQQGGAQKMTANALGQGKNQVVIFRQTTEQLLNDYLQQYAPQKTIMLNGLALTVENRVSCLSNRDYNTQFGTQFKRRSTDSTVETVQCGSHDSARCSGTERNHSTDPSRK